MEQLKMNAKEQYKFHREELKKMQWEMDKGLAGLLLAFPIRINYENWVFLHKIKGDYE